MGVIINAATIYRCQQQGSQNDIQAVTNGAIVFQGDTIKWTGPEADLPAEFAGEEKIDAGGGIVTPGLIDCHTHLAFGGWRGDEFQMRILGKTYLEIAEAGGGIASSVKQTRSSSESELTEKALNILKEIKTLGVTTVECKTGYGLTPEDEEKVLRVYQKLGLLQPLELVPTLLAAHIVPPEYRARREEYIKLVCEKIIPSVAEKGLARFCDVFVEESAFSISEATAVLEAGKKHGLRPKLHVDQLTPGNGAELAASVGAISADHLEYISDEGILRMLERGVTAVTLPLASLYTFQKPLNARRLIETGLPVAVATDFNPGSAPSYHLPFVMMLACTLNRMTPAEVLKGVTAYAARAVGLSDTHGSIEPGKKADLAIFDTQDINHWMYHLRPNCCVKTIKSGNVIHSCS